MIILGIILVIQRILDHHGLFILPLSASSSNSFMKVILWLLHLLSGDLEAALELLFGCPYFEVYFRSEWNDKKKQLKRFRNNYQLLNDAGVITHDILTKY